jgi:hypothetical protein
MTDEPDDIRKRLRAYLAASKEYEATFEQSPIADILAKDANGHYIVPVKDIVGRLFNDGPTSAASILAYLRADGDPLILEEYGAYLLRQSEGVEPDGTLDLTVLDDWESRYRGALSVLPGLQNKIDVARAAQGSLDKTVADHQATLDNFELSPAMLYVNHDPMTATEKLFSLHDTAGAMTALLERMNDDPEAIASLQKAVVDYILEKIGVTSDRAAEYLAFMARHEVALADLFGVTKMETFHNVAADLRRSAPQQSSPPEAKEGHSPTTTSKRGWRQLFRK